mgnify:CR=1 FL=1
MGGKKLIVMNKISKFVPPILFFAWSVLLVYFSLMPNSSVPGSDSTTFRWDFLEHMVAFGLFSFLYVFWRIENLKKKREFFQFMIIGILYAVFTELIQHFTDDRTVNPMDILFNFIGLFSGFYISILLFHKVIKTK